MDERAGTNVVRATWSGLAARVQRLEEAARTPCAELSVRRLAVVDERGQERIVGEARGDDAELRVQLDAGGLLGTASVVLFAYGARDGLDPTVGVQLWAHDEPLAELEVWPDVHGRWRAVARLSADDVSV
jgi:hypothetical protein